MALLIAATFLFTPYALNYDMVVLGWVLALIRQREGNAPLDHYLVVAVWMLPLTMMLAGLIHVPLAMPVLAAFAARLVWLLARTRLASRRTSCYLSPCLARRSGLRLA